MAASNVPAQSLSGAGAEKNRGRAGKSGRYYTPPSRIDLHKGVAKTETIDCNVFSGLADDLVASGIVTLAMLPGQPGDAGC